MSLSAGSIPPAAAPVWTWLPHPHGEPAQPPARAWLAAELGDPDLQVARDGRQRPHLLPPHEAWDCNWSHSGERLLVALARGARVGVDLERLHRRPRALEVAKRYFTDAEANWLAAQDDRDLAFLRLWCAKEAVLKAHGHGLSFGLHRLRFEPSAGEMRLAECDAELGTPEQWRLEEIVPGPGYLGAIAWRPKPL
ncbi:4'-phosphopantetheinyl transferase superfamily protein [Lysobacter sp. K5869]|uniref:4'-phosphopantetheinyl transferase family protein n=1 Tax=Lysobacter sp. K5869 TaxID=2820808 RepID=UPI001C05FD3D|nr:4'-phosphopantetheinyl transferase superfamily protein [Lysobacter sp. K5869]QWP77900.1 4'-phosphopantetheinyl transferase superfamily protein [Lysobacter sp. K5869]